jgi:hypothetical protein
MFSVSHMTTEVFPFVVIIILHVKKDQYEPNKKPGAGEGDSCAAEE